MFSKPRIYIRLTPEQVIIKNITTGAVFNETAYVAMTKGSKKNVIAVGVKAQQLSREMDIDLIAPFRHPRLIIGDYEAAAAYLLHGIRSISSRSFLAPVIIIQWMNEVNGGLAPIEARALQEMVQVAGSQKVYFIAEKFELSDQEVMAIK